MRNGSATDPPDRPGLMQLATSALDGGTTRRDALGLTDELEAAGATLGDDTSNDGTWLTASSLTGHAQAALAILSDVARNPTFPADEVERVRDEAIVALRQSRDEAATSAETVALREVYGAGHPYGHRSTGTEDGLRAATVDDLRRAHARAFTPTTTALLLSGDLTEDGSPAAYRRLAGIIGALGLPTVAVPGNHDDPELVASFFETPRIRSLGPWHLVSLDSALPGEVTDAASGRILVTSDGERPLQHPGLDPFWGAFAGWAGEEASAARSG